MVSALFHVQHLLGIGHARRAALIARAMADQGIAVTVAFGGMPLDDVSFGAARVVQLPPARAADAAFSAIVDQHDQPISDDWKARRRDRLLALAAEQRPEILLLEMFPFGRRAFRFELEPLLDAARAAGSPPVVASSVRDILVAMPAEKTAWMANAARRWLDLVLVHGDPDVVTLDASFPPADAISDLIRYTGYVSVHPPTGQAMTGNGVPGDDVLVSVGGGAVGEHLLRTALAAARKESGQHRWRLLTGPDLRPGAIEDLSAAAPAWVTVERFRTDFPRLLARCGVSVSQAGYNTVMDVLAAGCRAILVPFAEDGETEQTVRADLLADRKLATLVPATHLNPDRLAAAIATALAAPPPPRPPIALDGAARTTSLLIEAEQRRRAPS